jgi:hypothetical protein
MQSRAPALTDLFKLYPNLSLRSAEKTTHRRSTNGGAKLPHSKLIPHACCTLSRHRIKRALLTCLDNDPFDQLIHCSINAVPLLHHPNHQCSTSGSRRRRDIHRYTVSNMCRPSLSFVPHADNCFLPPAPLHDLLGASSCLHIPPLFDPNIALSNFAKTLKTLIYTILDQCRRDFLQGRPLPSLLSLHLIDEPPDRPVNTAGQCSRPFPSNNPQQRGSRLSSCPCRL